MTHLTFGLLLLVQVPSFAVQQQQDQRASIEGVVLRVGTDEPIAGAELKLMRVGSASAAAPGPTPSIAEAIGVPMLPSTQSDRNGRFVFKDVDAGSYRISAVRNGYGKLEYGQRVSRGTGTVITVINGQAVKDIVFRLTPAGSVSGSVRDAAGEPLTGLQVLLLRSRLSGSNEVCPILQGPRNVAVLTDYGLYPRRGGEYFAYGSAAGGGPCRRGSSLSRKFNTESPIISAALIKKIH